MAAKHIVIDARIRRASTGKPVDRLLEYLQQLDSENQYTILLEPDDTWKPTASNFSTLPIDFRQFSFNPLQQLRYGRVLYNLKPDLVHFTLTGQAPLFYFGNQTTMTHDLTMLRFARPGRLPSWLHAIRMVGYRLLFWFGNRMAKHIIVPTKFVAEDLTKHYPFTKSKHSVIYEASEPPISAKSEPLPAATKPFILHVGSPLPHKNIERLIEVFERLIVDKPDLKLVLPGKQEFYFGQLQKQIDASSAKDSIVVPGFVSAGQLKWLYQNASAYVLPSLSEGFGLPGLEAMVHDCPLVSSNATCLPEVYGDAAHYFDPLDVNDMAKKIGEVLDDKELRSNLIKKGHTQAVKYSWKRMTEQTLEIFNQNLR